MANTDEVSSKTRNRKTYKEYKEKFRSKRSNEEKDLERSKDKNRKSEKRLNMTEEERNLVKEKDRIRKQKKRRENKEKNKANLHKRKVGAKVTRAEYNRNHKRISRDKRSEEQKEFERIEQVIMMRKQRKLRDGKAHLLDNLEAKREMRSLREIGPLKDYMRRKAREQDEEMMWNKFWGKDPKCREILQKKKPEFVRLFQEREEQKRKEREEYERNEQVLDKKGRWKYNNCNGEYYWSIPDENGHNISLAEFNKEDEEVPLTKEEILQKAKERRELEGESQEDRDNEDEAYRQALREIYDYDGEMRRRKRKEKQERLKEELSRPIDMPDCGEKCEYEKQREENIRARYEAMKESGMFCDKELNEMLRSKIYE